jgi:hypothetical protein
LDFIIPTTKNAFQILESEQDNFGFLGVGVGERKDFMKKLFFFFYWARPIFMHIIMRDLLFASPKSYSPSDVPILPHHNVENECVNSKNREKKL